MSEFAEGYAVGQNSNNGYNGMCGGKYAVFRSLRGSSIADTSR